MNSFTFFTFISNYLLNKMNVLLINKTICYNMCNVGAKRNVDYWFLQLLFSHDTHVTNPPLISKIVLKHVKLYKEGRK